MATGLGTWAQAQSKTRTDEPLTAQHLSTRSRGAERFFLLAASSALVMAGLHYGQPVLMPLVCAALLAFVLNPLVSGLRRVGLPLVLAVVLVVTLVLAAAGASGVLVARQVATLGQDLPQYQSTVRRKLRALRVPGASDGALLGATKLVALLEGEMDAARAAMLPQAPKPAQPITRVQLEPAPATAFRALSDVARPLITPLASAGLVIVLLSYMLVQRRELSDRLVLLMGGDLHSMANLLNDAAGRVSRYLATQLMVNLGFGLCLSTGLWLVGVPAAFLWGALAALMRFVPYLGTLFAAAFPLLLAFAVDPGWNMVAATAALIVVLELAVVYVIEPLAYSGSTGVSPVAVLLSAALWVLIWGPMGLVLATPLTVCLVVLGRHLGALKFLDVLLGVEPAFDPPTVLYRRLIAGDNEEAIELSTSAVEGGSVVGFYSELGVPMLALAAQSAEGDASPEQRYFVQRGVKRILEDLRDRYPAPASAGASVLCLGARNEVDTLSAEMLAHALAQQGLAAVAVPAVAISADRIGQLNLDGVHAVVLCGFQASPATHARFVSRRLRRRKPALHITLAAWAPTKEPLDPVALASIGADAWARTPDEVCKLLLRRSELEGWAGEVPAAVADEVDAATGAEVDLRDLLARAAQRAAEIFGVPLASVVLLRPAGRPMYENAGRATGTFRAGHAPEADDSPLAAVMSSNETLVIADTERVPQFAAQPGGRFEGLVAFAGVPLRDKKGVLLGALALHDATAREFSAAELALLASIAHTLAGDVLQLLAAGEPPPAAASTLPGDAPSTVAPSFGLAGNAGPLPEPSA